MNINYIIIGIAVIIGLLILKNRLGKQKVIDPEKVIIESSPEEREVEPDEEEEEEERGGSGLGVMMALLFVALMGVAFYLLLGSFSSGLEVMGTTHPQTSSSNITSAIDTINTFKIFSMMSLILLGSIVLGFVLILFKNMFIGGDGL